MIDTPTLALAAQHADLLRAIDGGQFANKAALAEALSRDPSNLNKTLKALVDGGLMDSIAIDAGLNAAGRNALAAVDRAAGGAGEGTVEPGLSPLPHGLIDLLHDQLRPDPDNARQDWDSEEASADLGGLADDIAERGLLQNPTVCVPPGGLERADPLAYQLVGGERRWRAIGTLIADGRWPADRPITCRLLSGDALDLRIAALAENLLRRDLNPIEKARGFDAVAAALIEQGVDKGRVNADIAARIGKTPEHVQQHRRFLQLDEADQARMALPRDDPRHLSVREARQKLSGLAELDKAREEFNALPLAERLAMIELTHAVMTHGGYRWDDVAITGQGAGSEAGLALAERQWIRFADPVRHGKPELNGHFRAALGYQAPQRLLPLDCDAEARNAALAAIQAEAGHSDAEGGYVTPWLNTPDEIPAEGQALLDAYDAANAEREAAWEAQRQQAAADRQKRAECAAMMRAHAEGMFTASRAAPAVTEALTDVRMVFDQLGRALPLRAFDNGCVMDATGEEEIAEFAGYGPATDEAITLAMTLALAVNHAAGVETPELGKAGGDEDEDADTEDAGEDEAAVDAAGDDDGEGDQ